MIRDCFLNYELQNSDFTATLGSRDLEVHDGHGESGWGVMLAETGQSAVTGDYLHIADVASGCATIPEGEIEGIGNIRWGEGIIVRALVPTQFEMRYPQHPHSAEGCGGTPRAIVV